MIIWSDNSFSGQYYVTRVSSLRKIDEGRCSLSPHARSLAVHFGGRQVWTSHLCHFLVEKQALCEVYFEINLKSHLDPI